MLNLKSLAIHADRVSMPIEDLPEFINLLEINSRIKQIESKISEIASAPQLESKSWGFQHLVFMYYQARGNYLVIR